MNTEQVDKSIKQMRSIFALWGVGALFGLCQVALIIPNVSSVLELGFVGLFVLIGVLLATCFWWGFVGLGQRSPLGYTLARTCSVILLLGFPIWTYLGYSYLKKLKTPAMKLAFQVT